VERIAAAGEGFFEPAVDPEPFESRALVGGARWRGTGARGTEGSSNAGGTPRLRVGAGQGHHERVAMRTCLSGPAAAARFPARVGAGNRSPCRQPALQAAPLRVKEDGAAALPVWLAWKPMEVEAPGARAPL
jgi:hypothetical protein